ncbi:MAG: S8 family serine peptidase [Pseudomonadales bacterium]|nr:S8 family serine peptidase [Planctomycetaceae bacterium]MCB1672096.1 S8 family serine peptidase [Pseudomonadales bacterium]MCP5347965.1 S8 family serine peptidase [Pseudomonadales bacterium]
MLINRLRIHLHSVLIALVGLLIIACHVSGAEQDPSSMLNSLYTGSGEEAEKIILVLHRGRPGNEMASGSRLTMYRSRSYNPDITWNRRVSRSLAERYGLNYLTDWWMSEIDVNCAVLRVPQDQDTGDVLAALLADPEVVTAQQLSIFSTLGEEPNDPYFELQSSARYFDLTGMHVRSTGRNILIAIVDTGIETKHQDLDGQFHSSRNFVEQVSPGFTEDMHGTAVAGVIAARANNAVGIVGMAPDAKLLGLKACWPVETGKLAAVCNSFTLALAIN